MGTFQCPRIKFQLILIVLVFLWHQSYAGTCKEGCPAASQTSRYKFSPGQVYNYNLDSQVTIYLSGSRHQTQVKVNGVAKIYYAGNCKYYLMLPKLQISSSGDAVVSTTKDLQKPVKFILSNDELSPEICTDGTDTEFSLNIKRAIISLVQSVDGKSHETDVFGVCPTSTLTSNVGDSVIVTKTRDLNACSHREFLSDGFIKGIFNEASGIKSTPVLNGDYTLEQKIKNGILDTVTLTEQYVYLPFSTQNTGARAKVVTKLTFVNTETNEAPQPQKPKERTLLYQNFKTTTTTNPSNAKNLLIDAVGSFNAESKGVGKETAQKFANLVRALRRSKKDDLVRLYDDIKKGSLKLDKELARKVYLDALFRAGSANSISVVSDLMKKEFNDKEQRLAFLSFNLAQTVTKDTLVAASKTLGPLSPREAFMGLGTLVKKYCADKVCGPNDVKDIYVKYGNNLGSCKPTTRVQEDKTVAVLKAIRNAGIIVEPVSKKIEQCLTNTVSSRVRVAALQAIGSSTCAKNLQSKMLDLLKDRAEDSEIRIEAYLALIKCPTPTLANEIKALLDDEPVYQVGSFITSHLSNIRASADPYRESLRRIFGNIRLSHRFPSDIRKYSFNREISYTVDSLGLGASIDNNVIYSQKGFLPRSGSFNVTSELFGNIFNVLEVSVRQENLEHVLEHYFGPKGELKSTNFQELFNNALESYNSIVEGTKKRFKRAVAKDAVSAFTKDISYQNEVFSDVEIDLSVKLFGTELYFLSLADDVPSNPKDFIAAMFKVLDKNIKDAKNFNKVYENHVIFLDAELIYPSGIGLPLKLGAQGVAAGRVELGGKTDVQQWKKSPEFAVTFIPSVNIDISSTLLVDALSVQAGLKLEGNLHSSTGSEIEFKLSEDKKVFDLKIGFPFKNQEVISFKTNTLFVVYDVEKGNIELPVTLEGQKNRKHFSDCFDQFVPLVGVNVCPGYELNLGEEPNSLSFPFAGPNSVSLKLEFEREFTLRGVYDDSKPKHKILTYTFDTPKSDISRKTELQFEVGYETDYFARMALDHVGKKSLVEAGLKKNDKEFALYAEAQHGGNDYLAKFGFNVQGNEARSEYTPIIVIKGPNMGADHVGGYKVEGKIVAERNPPSAKYSFNNIKVITPTNANYIVNGFISHDDSNVNYDLTYLQESVNKKANLKGGFGYKEKERFLMDIAFVNDFNDQLNGQVKYEYNHKQGSSCKNDFLIVYGKDLASSKNRFHFFHDASYSKDEKDGFKTLNGKVKVEAPFVPLLITFDHEYRENYAKFNFDFESQPHKVNVYSINKYNTKTKGDYDVEVGGTFNKRNMKATAVRVVGDKASDHSYHVTSDCGFEFDLKGKFGNSIDIDNLSADFEAKTIVPFKKDTPYVLKFFLKSTKVSFKSNANLMEGSKSLATYTTEGKRGDNTEGTFNIEVVNIFTGQGDFKSVKGKGSLSSLITFKKLDRKVKVESDFNIARPVYDVNTKFFYDYEKDNNKKIEFTTKNNIAPNDVNTKNTLLILSEQYTFNLNMKQTGSNVNGNLNGGFEFILPTGRKLAGTYDRHRETTDDKVNAKIKVDVFDQLPNGDKRTLALDSNIKNADFKQRLFDMTHKMTFTDFNKKDVTLTSSAVRSRTNTNTKNVKVGFKVDGSLLPHPMSMNLVHDMVEDDKVEVMTVNGKYGTQLDFDLHTKYDIHYDDSRPSTHEVKLVVNVPDTKIKTIKLESSGSYKEPEDKDGQYESKYRGSMTFGDKVLAVDKSVKANDKTGDIKLAINLPDFDPINIKMGYNRQEESNEIEKGHIDFEMVYGKNQKVNFKADSSISQTEIIWKGTLQSPLEKANNIGLDFDWKFTGGNKYTTLIKLDVDKRAYSYNSIIVLSEISPIMSIELVYPEKTIKMYLAVQKLEDFKYATQVKLENVMNYNLDMNAEALFKSPENFYLKLNLDSTNLKKVVVEINSKPGGKGVEFKGIKDGKNLLSGTADFQVKEDKGKTIIEGSGNVKWYEESQVTTFKFIRNKFEAKTDGEVGVSFVFDGRLGNKNIISELKLTDKNVALKHTVCEAKKQCVNIDLRSTLQKADINDFKHELLISIDLRELGYSHEFGLKADTSKLGMVFDHTVDMHLQSQDKNKYQYSLYIHKNSAGITLTLPARTISLESTYVYPTDQLFGKYETGIQFYLDKAHNPNGKTSLAFIGNLDRFGKNVIKAKGDLRLEHPNIKALSVSGLSTIDADSQKANIKVIFDVFQQENKKIVSQFSYENSDKSGKGFNVTTSANVNSKGLKMDLEFDSHAALNYDTRSLSIGSTAVCPSKEFVHSMYLFANEKVFELYAKIFGEEVLKVAANYDIEKRSASYNSVFKQLGTTPVVVTGQVDGLTTASLVVTKGNLIDVKGQFDLGKEASVNVVGDSKQLFNGKVALDDAQFLATKFKVQEDDIKAFLEKLKTTVKTENEAARKAYTDRFEQTKASLVSQFKDITSSFPDFGKLKEDYKKQWEKFKAELQADPTIKSIADWLVETFTAITKIVDEVTKHFLEFYEKISSILSDFYKQMEEVFETKIMPILKDIYSEIESVVYKLYEEVVSIIAEVFERVAKSLKGFEEDFNKISQEMSQLFKNISSYLKEYLEQLQKELKDLYSLLIQQLQALPGLDVIKTKIEEFFGEQNVGEHVATVMKELLSLIRDHLPTEDSKEFVKKLGDYIEAKLTNQKVDDMNTLKDLFELSVKAIRSIFKMLTLDKDGDIAGWTGAIPISFEAFKRMSYVWNVKFSPLQCLREPGCFSIRDWLSYRPYGFQFTELFPPFSFHAHIGDGEHLFTFDGRHLTFPGSCNYVLVHDAYEGNFTLVANLVNGKMDSLTLFDKGDSVEITKSGIVNLNGAATELPAHKDDIHVWRRYYSISVLTRYGLNILCSTDLRVCHVTVSGYYHGRLRGLLGNGNHEPYDDFTTPKGDVIESDVDFGNQYKMDQGCKPVAPIAHSHETNEMCSQLFGSGSSLRLCYFMVNNKNFKEACSHAVSSAKDKQDAACNIALLYASTCLLEKIPVSIPDTCGKCHIDNKEYEFGDEFHVQVPSKQADAVIVVDTALKSLSELVGGIVADLRKEFATRQITDSRITVIGFNQDDKYTSLFTTKGGLDFSGKFPPVELNGPKIEKPIKTGNEKVDEFSEKLFTTTQHLRAELGLSSAAEAVRLALDYPFRPQASKTILLVKSEGFSKASPARLAITHLAQGVAKLQGIFFHTLLPLDDFSVEGLPETKRVVGFNEKNVFVLNDGRKRPEGSPDLRNKIAYKNDDGIEVALQNNGMVFALQNYDALDGKLKKLFTQTLSASIADQISRTEQKLDCTCVEKHGLFPEQVCYVEETKVLPPKKLAARG